MEFSLTTFALEIVNFLVLVAILKHWFYTPVLKSIERRRESLKAELDSAEETRQKALDLQKELEEKMVEQEQEAREARARLNQEIKEQREELQKELDKERVKARESGKAELELEAQHNQVLALEQGSRFASRLLTELADPRLQELMVELTVKELEKLDEETLKALRAEKSVKVSSAFPLSKSSRTALEKSLGKLELKENPELLAGVALQAGDCYLGANLKDELELFRRTVHG